MPLPHVVKKIDLSTGRGRGRSRSTNFGRGAGSLSGDRYSDRYSLDRLELASNVSEPAGTPPLQPGEVVYVCPICGQVMRPLCQPKVSDMNTLVDSL